jgi:hypothetical protein
MKLVKIVTLITAICLTIIDVASGFDRILVVRFDSQDVSKHIADGLADSIVSNLKKIGVPVVSHDLWDKLLKERDYNESDINYNPTVLSGLLLPLAAKGAVYGQLYRKNEMFVIDCYYIEVGSNKSVDLEPMVGATEEDIYKLAEEIALILSRPDKKKPKVMAVVPPQGAIDVEQYTQINVFFDEPMNPHSYGLEGEPEDMFYAYGEVEYNPQNYCFTFNVHLYQGKAYRFRVNGPSLKPFKDTSGNVAQFFEWSFSTKQ